MSPLMMDQAAAAAALRYHGKTKPPLPTHHMVEFEALVTWTGGVGLVPPSAYRLENVAGKLVMQGDVLHYRIVFLDEKYCVPLSSTMNVCVAPIANSSEYPRRRNGRPEVGFTAGPFPEYLSLPVAERPPFIHTVAFDIVVDAATKSRIAEIYFEIEDCDTTALPEDAPRSASHAPPSMGGGGGGGGPLWRLGIDSSSVLEQMTQHDEPPPGVEFKAVWLALPPLHPDPAVDPGVPVERRPQRKPRWYWFRSQGPKEIGGNLSGTKWYKLLGAFPDQWDRDAKEVFNGNPLTRAGRMLESSVVLSHLLYSKHVPGTRYEECGTFPHPTIPNVSATPDAIIRLPSAKVLPAWFKDLFSAEQLAKMDLTRGTWECKTIHSRDKKTGMGARFKPEYLPQVYAEMICTGTWWGELTCYCPETGEMRTFPVFRDPDTSDKFEKCIKRMHDELAGGTPFKVACKHPTNIDLVRVCAQAASFFNKDITPPRYAKDNWNTALAEEFASRCARYDTVSSYPDDPKGKTITESNTPQTPGKEKKQGGGGGGRKSPTTAKTTTTKKRERDDSAGGAEIDSVEKVFRSSDNSSVKFIWKGIQEATGAITKTIKADQIDMDLVSAMESQLVRYSRLMCDVVVLVCARDINKSATIQKDLNSVAVPSSAIAADDDEDDEEDDGMVAIVEEEDNDEEAAEIMTINNDN